MSGHTRGLLIDLDDTLYDYEPAERAGRAALIPLLARDLSMDAGEVVQRLESARRRVKQRVAGQGCSHSRLLYLHELAHESRAPHAWLRVRGWERAFWQAYLSAVRLRPCARELLTGWRQLGHRTAIITDLVLEVQLWKLEVLRVGELIDAVVVSEEVAHDKPAPQLFELAIERLGLNREACVVVGDDETKDGAGAHALGLPFLRVESSSREGGFSLRDVARKLGVTT